LQNPSGHLSTQDLTALRHKLEQAFRDFYAGQIGPASLACRDILGQLPQQPDALHLSAMIAYRLNRLEIALQLFDETLKVAPQLAQAWSNRALVLRILGRKDEALASAFKANVTAPDMASGWDIAGLLLREKRNYDDAIEYHARAAFLDPDNAMIQNNYAVALAARHRLDDAWQAARKAEILAPTMAAVHLTLANILSSAGYYERALAYYKKSAALDPNLTDILVNQARAHFLLGDYDEGWAHMEKRSYDKTRFADVPRWQGEKTGHLLLYAEQGIGDVIHFLRYVPLIRDRAEKITLQVPDALKKLIAAHMPNIPLITAKDPLPKADAFGLLMSAPYFLKTTLSNIPASIPYLHAEETWRAPWRAKLAHRKRPLLGFTWAGNPNYANDHIRSLAFATIKPLLALAPDHFISLQKGSSLDADSRVYDAAPSLHDFTATAGLVAECDLVISVDTAVAHLAGAMGKPVWTLIAYSPDWRWLLGREDTPWYPTMRLFRQKAPGDWTSAIDFMIPELRRFLEGDQTVLTAKPFTGPTPHQPEQLYTLTDID
jgi:tetratricopeptide (TPR) repeat protein